MIIKLNNVLVNEFLLTNTKQVFLRLFFLIKISKNSLNSRNKSYNNAENNATLLNYSNKANSNYMLIKKVIAKGWFNPMYYNVVEK